MEKLKIHTNEDGGFQIEFQGVLLTVGRNENYGISGAVCLMLPGNKQIREVTFHGGDPHSPFPVQFHDETKALN